MPMLSGRAAVCDQEFEAFCFFIAVVALRMNTSGSCNLKLSQ